MPTGQVIVTNALIALGLNEQGGTPNVSDSVDALGELNVMWDGWGIDEDMIFAILAQQFALTINVGAYPIGPAAASPFNVARPQRIYKASFIPASAQRIPLEIVEATRYFSHHDLAAAAKSPDELYPDYSVDPTTGSANLYLWPIQSVAGTLELNMAVKFIAWALGTNYNVPAGYQDAIEKTLAFRLLPRFGVAVDPKVAEVVTALAQKAEARIAQMNRVNRQKPAPATQEAQQ